jgi:hypothetical protein
VDASKIREAEQLIDSCEHCRPDDAEIPFDWILGKITGMTGNVWVRTDRIGTVPELSATG